MKILSYLQENYMISRLRGTSADQIKNAFFANYCAALVLIKIQDIQGLRLINDPGGAVDLSRFNGSMSDVNFWARCLFHSTNPAIKGRLLHGHAELLAQEASRISLSRIKEIVRLPLKSPNSINWQEVTATLFLLRERFSVRSTYFNNLIRYFFKWDGLFGTAQKKAVNDAFMYLLQSDPKSALLTRLRALSNSVMISTLDTTIKTITGFRRLNEEDGGSGGEGADTTSAGNISTTDSSNCIVSPPNHFMGNYMLPGTDKTGDVVKKKNRAIIKDGKIIKRRKKTFKFRWFKAPDFMSPTQKPAFSKSSLKDFT